MRLAAIMLLASLLAAQDSPNTTPKPAPQPGIAAAVCADAEITEFGLDCSIDEPCPVYLELSGAEAAGDRIFLTGNLHTTTATLWSLLAMSEDGGKTWSEPVPRIRGAALDLIQFFDAETGWAAGQIAGALPKDPFLLKTTDGGRTWRRTQVFEDSSYGVVEQFSFTSKTQGSLLVNRRGARNERYQSLETMSGGDSWMMRETSAKPISVPKPRAPEWRVRVDAQARAHRLERRQDSRWTVVSSFPVRGGECKPKPPEAPKEPDPN
jgi:hypothetical protein